MPVSILADHDWHTSGRNIPFESEFGIPLEAIVLLMAQSEIITQSDVPCQDIGIPRFEACQYRRTEKG